MVYNSDEVRLWFRQGQLTIESSDCDLDKILVTYNQVESNQFKFPHVDSNCMWLFKTLIRLVFPLEVSQRHSPRGVNSVISCFLHFLVCISLLFAYVIDLKH